jgi:Protein of unknown function (DUF4236)
MGWNVRRSRKIAPGIRLNISNRGLGLSVGPKHAKISFSPTGRVTQNIGIPGTGIRYTKTLSTRKKSVSGGAQKVTLARRHLIPLDAWIAGIAAYSSVSAIFDKVNRYSGNPNQPNDLKSRALAALVSIALISWVVFSIRRRFWLNMKIQMQLNEENQEKS